MEKGTEELEVGERREGKGKGEGRGGKWKGGAPPKKTLPLHHWLTQS